MINFEHNRKLITLGNVIHKLFDVGTKKICRGNITMSLVTTAIICKLYYHVNLFLNYNFSSILGKKCMQANTNSKIIFSHSCRSPIYWSFIWLVTR